MTDYFKIWIRIFTFLLFITAVIYYIWMQKLAKKKLEKRRTKKSSYTIKQMKEIK